MNPKKPLKDKLYPTYGDDNEYYYEEESKMGAVAKFLLYTLLVCLCTVCVWFFAIYLPDYFIPEGKDLEGIVKVSDLDVVLKPLSESRVKQLGLNDVGVSYFMDEDEELDIHDNDAGAIEHEDEDNVEVSKLDHARAVDRLIVIGDIHGYYTKLRKLLRKLNFNHKTDHVLMLGDFISKGPDSIKVLDFAISNNLDCILGNHEWYVLQNYAQFHRLDAPRFIDEVSLSDFEINEKFNNDPEYLLAKKLQPHHVEYINSCLVIKRLGKVPSGDSATNGFGYTNGVAVHGGLRWDLPFEDQDGLKCLEMRSYIGPHFNESTDDPSEENAVSWSKIWNKKQKMKPIKQAYSVYYGHDARRGLKVKPFSKGLDTGCFKGGRLTAMVIWEEEHRASRSKDTEVLHKEKLVSISC